MSNRRKLNLLEFDKLECGGEMETKTVRIERRLLEEAREKFPELRDVSDADVVRIIFRKILGGGKDG